MARMIDADRLLRELTALSHGQVWPGWTYDGIRLLIERQPTLTQPNEPLTWEELKEMAGEPVYIVEPKKAISSWMLIDMVDEESMWCVVGFGSSYLIFYKTYGKTWLAYRRPPEGEEDTQ